MATRQTRSAPSVRKLSNRKHVQARGLPADVRKQLLTLAGDGPLKFDGGKVRLELVPPELVEGAGRALTFGARKYSAGNWATPPGFEWSRLLGGLKRHIMEFEKGVTADPESGLCPLDHAACMLGFLMAHRERGLGTDDRIAIGVRPRNSAAHVQGQPAVSRPRSDLAASSARVAQAPARRRSTAR